jgi:SPP1 gp7 family putative phage head morphogenesis protein
LAIPSFEKSRIDTLVKGASKEYLTGAQTAYKRLGKKIIADDVKDGVTEFLKIYKKQLNDGYTIIQGEKVFWLRDRTLAERQKIFNIISEGITQGKTPATVKKEFQDYFSMQKRQAERIARTETAYVQANGRDDHYKKYGVEKVKWLLGPNPCPECLDYGNKIYTWDTLPKSQPVHVLCTCDLAPVLD